MYHFWVSSSSVGGVKEVGDRNSALFQWIVPFCNIHSPIPKLNFHSLSLWKACEFPCSSSITKWLGLEADQDEGFYLWMEEQDCSPQQVGILESGELIRIIRVNGTYVVETMRMDTEMEA